MRVVPLRLVVAVAVPPVVAGAEVPQVAGGMDWADLQSPEEPVQTEPTLLRVVAMWEA